MYISIGVDCGMAGFLKQHNLRECSMPFDWVVSYLGVAEIIRNRFINYLPTTTTTNLSTSGVLFLHDCPRETMQRRIDRMMYTLQTYPNEVVFIRKGHALHHHGEYDKIKDDLEDVEELSLVLKEVCPNLRFRIIVVLVCPLCFVEGQLYSSNHPEIVVYNIVIQTCQDRLSVETIQFNELMTRVLLLEKNID